MAEIFMFAIAFLFVCLGITALILAWEVMEGTAAYQAWQLKRFWKKHGSE